MAVIIEGMEMPKNCVDCIFGYEVTVGIEAACIITRDEKDDSYDREIDCKDGYCQNRPDWCPLKEVK